MISAHEAEKEVKTPFPSSSPQQAEERAIENSKVSGRLRQKSEDTLPPDNQIIVSDDENSSTCGRSNHSDMSVEHDPSQNLDSVVAVYPPLPATAKVTILQMDLQTVDDGNELNDSIVDFFILYTADTCTMGHEMLQKSHIMSSFFFTSLSQKQKKNGSLILPSAKERYARASSFTTNVDLFEKDYIFIPVCRSRHWFLAVIYDLPCMTSSKDCHKQAPILMVDSIVWNSGFSDSPSSREQEADLIRSFLSCEWQERNGTGTSRACKFDEESMPVMYPKVPQQENGYDCGVFVLLFFREFLKQKFPVEELMSGEILDWYRQEEALRLRHEIGDLLLRLGS